MFLINDVCWYGIIWVVWVLIMKNSRFGVGRVINFIFGNDEIVFVVFFEV